VRRAAGRAGTSGRPWLFAALYVALCAGLAAAAFFQESPNPGWFWALLLVTLPISPAVFLLHYVGGVLLFGPNADGWFVCLVVFLLWVTAAIAQAIAAVALTSWMRATRGG
jgi:hypothetical protein